MIGHCTVLACDMLVTVLSLHSPMLQLLALQQNQCCGIAETRALCECVHMFVIECGWSARLC